MSLQNFISEAISPWMKNEGPDADIVLSKESTSGEESQKYPLPAGRLKRRSGGGDQAG